jgi:hypothetical protein
MNDPKLLKPFLIAFGVGQLVLGVLLWAFPGFFFDEIGPYGTRNDHYMGDIATLYLALGAASLVAIQRPSWRLPVLAFAALQYLLHSINHLIDIGDADPEWLGPANFIALVLTFALLVWALQLVIRGEGDRVP